MRFDAEPDDEDNFETVTKTDIHIQMNPMQPGMNVADFPQNPYSERIKKSDSLFFEDGQRSVDFVLVWKKLVPCNDEARSEVLRNREIEDIKKKEDERTKKRDVFEENLVNEGLEIEKEIVDEEINFVKIHAPLEVLRRYAEILKLRLPMKEVSQMTFILINTNNENKFGEKTESEISTSCEVVFCTCCLLNTKKFRCFECFYFV